MNLAEITLIIVSLIYTTFLRLRSSQMTYHTNPDLIYTHKHTNTAKLQTLTQIEAVPHRKPDEKNPKWRGKTLADARRMVSWERRKASTIMLPNT